MSKVADICLFGEFSIEIKNADVSSKFKTPFKRKSIIEYIILKKGPVTLAELSEVEWGENKSILGIGAIKTGISRIRKIFDDNGYPLAIITRAGAYLWNRDICTIDTDEFDDIAQKIETETLFTDSLKRRFEKILKLYKGELLSNEESACFVEEKREYYRTLFLKLMRKYVDFLKVEGLYKDVLRVCEAVLHIYSAESSFNMDMVMALIKLGENKVDVTVIKKDSANVDSTDKMKSYYNKIIKSRETVTIEKINEELLDEEINGAFVCEYSLFKEIYYLHMRNLGRLGQSMFLVLVSVTPKCEEDSDPERMNEIMKKLQDVLVQRLRTGDTISRYSATQFTALLPSAADEEVGRTVMERLKGNFYEEEFNKNYNFSYKLIRIENTFI